LWLRCTTGRQRISLDLIKQSGYGPKDHRKNEKSGGTALVFKRGEKHFSTRPGKREGMYLALGGGEKIPRGPGKSHKPDLPVLDRIQKGRGGLIICFRAGKETVLLAREL